MPLWAQTIDKPQPELITLDTQEAIDAGLAYLAKKQIKTGGNRGAFGTSGYGAGIVGTAMACIILQMPITSCPSSPSNHSD